MANDVIETKSELTGETKPLKKKPKWWQIALDAALVTVFVLTATIAGNVIYLSVAYSEPFYVNGMSMYPTLNRNGLRFEDGSYRALTWADSSNREGDIVDYGYSKADNKDNWKANLKRNDIVITYYASDYVDITANPLVLKKGVYPKIKRVIGLPGETVDFSAVINNDEYGNTAWGKTLVNGEPLKPLYGPSDFPDVSGRHYDKVLEPKYPHVELGEDEYYLIGDNRGGFHSDDSRDQGPIKADWIFAKACVVVSMRQLKKEEEGYSALFRLDHVRMPWNYLTLE